MISSILRGWGRKECKTSNDLVVGLVRSEIPVHMQVLDRKGKGLLFCTSVMNTFISKSSYSLL